MRKASYRRSLINLLKSQDATGTVIVIGAFEGDGLIFGLVSYWPLNGNVQDPTANNNHGGLCGEARRTSRRSFHVAEPEADE